MYRRYVDISETEEEIDIQATIDELKKLEKEKQELGIEVNANLNELGFKDLVMQINKQDQGYKHLKLNKYSQIILYVP